jgi:hypothetical protein
MSKPVFMPIRSERTAPSFDRTKPREFTRFFDDLEHLFELATVNHEADKKKYVLYYVDFETEQMWRWLPTYSDTAKTYADFKAEIFGFYPKAADNVYSICDVQTLITNQQRLGIGTVADLREFHLHYLMITQWLINRQYLCELEQRRSYIKAFPPTLLQSALFRLQIKFPDHDLNIPYPITDIYKAAQFILLYNSASEYHYYTPVRSEYQSLSVVQAPTAPKEPLFNAENLSALVPRFTKAVNDVISWYNQSRPGHLEQQTNSNRTPSRQSVKDRIAEIQAEIASLKSQDITHHRHTPAPAPKDIFQQPNIGVHYVSQPTSTPEYFHESEYALTGPRNIGQSAKVLIVGTKQSEQSSDSKEIEIPVVSLFAVTVAPNRTPLQDPDSFSNSVNLSSQSPDRLLAISAPFIFSATFKPQQLVATASLVVGKSLKNPCISLGIQNLFHQLHLFRALISADTKEAADDRFIGG